jgi:hypothetical protein
VFLRQQNLHPRLFQHERETFRRERRVERHVSAAGLQHAEHRDDELGRTLDADAYARLAADSARVQVVG